MTAATAVARWSLRLHAKLSVEAELLRQVLQKVHWRLSEPWKEKTNAGSMLEGRIAVKLKSGVSWKKLNSLLWKHRVDATCERQRWPKAGTYNQVAWASWNLSPRSFHISHSVLRHYTLYLYEVRQHVQFTLQVLWLISKCWRQKDYFWP